MNIVNLVKIMIETIGTPRDMTGIGLATVTKKVVRGEEVVGCRSLVVVDGEGEIVGRRS